MLPLVEVDVIACNGSSSEACGFVSLVSSSVSESGDFIVDEIAAYLSGVTGPFKSIVFDGVQYEVHSTKAIPSQCSVKVNAFRLRLFSCDTCAGQIFTGVIPADCDEDSEGVGSGTAVNFSMRHLTTTTKVINDSVTHLETYELMFEGRPNLNSDNIVTGCGKSFKVKSIENKDDIRKPLRAVAEVTPFPRATV